MINLLSTRHFALTFPLLILVLSLPARASRFSEALLPLVNETQQLMISNPTTEPQTLWITKPVKADIGPEEQKWDIPASSKIEIPLQDYKGEAFLRLESTSEKLQSFWKLSPTEPWTQLPWGVSNELKLSHPLIQTSLWISNPTGSQQSFQLIGADNGIVYQSGALKSYETQNIVYRGTTSRLTLIGENRMAALAHDDLFKRGTSLEPQMSHFLPTSHASLFEVASLDGRESFVVEIADEKLLREARTQVASPQAFVSRLLVAEVAEGNQHINQDQRSPHKAPWSWHVKQVYRFADFGSIDCDGSPSLVEKTLPWWTSNKGGLICFWGYKLVREITSP